MAITGKVEDRLRVLAHRCLSDRRLGATVCVIIYTVVFAMFFACHTLFGILDTGSILGGDGIEQTYPFLLDLRSNTIYFFETLLDGNPQITLINLQYGMGTDTITGIAMFFMPLLRVFMLSALFPASAAPMFLTVIVVLLSYAAGDRILSVNLLYSDGWTAYVDGEKAPVYKANGLFLGIPLTEGISD